MAGNATPSQRRPARALLLVVSIPVVILVGVLATAVLDSGRAEPPQAVVAPVTVPQAAPAAVAAAQAPARTRARVPVARRGATTTTTTTTAKPPPAPAKAPAPPSETLPEEPPVAVVAPPPPPRPIPQGHVPADVARVEVGTGAQGATILRSPTASSTRPGPVVIFLHGWVATDPDRYGPWIGHLVHEGATVVYPAYQSRPAYDTISPLRNAIAGIRAALEQVPVAPGRLVVAGHSAGGALAADYAAVAVANGLPAPAAVFSVYPGRKLRHLAVPIPAVDLSTIAPGTRLLVYAGERDTAVGTGAAERIVAGAPQADATLHVVRDDAVDEHSAPRRFDGAAQRTFWEPLDALVAATATARAPGAAPAP